MGGDDKERLGRERCHNQDRNLSPAEFTAVGGKKEGWLVGSGSCRGSFPFLFETIVLWANFSCPLCAKRKEAAAAGPSSSSSRIGKRESSGNEMELSPPLGKMYPAFS